MWKTRFLAVMLCAMGFAQTGRAASFDFSFLDNGVSVGQGSFSFPDASLSLPFVRSGQFTSFSLTTGGFTFGLPNLRDATYLPSTNSFSFGQFLASGFGYFMNGPYLPVPSAVEFSVSGSYYEPCYFDGKCGPQYPPVFNGYAVQVVSYSSDVVQQLPQYTQRYLAGFDTLLITPTASAVPEPGTGVLLAAPIIGLGLLMRRRRAE